MSSFLFLSSSPFIFLSPFPSLPIRPLRPLSVLPISNHQLLQTLTTDPSNTSLPSLRSYDTDLANLALVGSVSSSQALTAAAADGGDAADEHLSGGLSTMVVETVFPGPLDHRSTVSTRLFLPAEEVKKKAAKLSSRLSADILSSYPAVSKNILAITFRQVVVHQLWSFELSVFRPGSRRDIEDLGTAREAVAEFSVSSSDGRFLSTMAEVLCAFALGETERRNSGDSISSYMLPWFQLAHGKCSADSSVCVYRLPESEVVKNALSQVEKYNSVKMKYSSADKKMKNQLFVAPTYSKLEKIGGAGFNSWANEFIPAYKVQIDASFSEAAKLEGWHQLADNRWEVLLTHSQMVELASILDMYYEDRCTLPDKQLVSSFTTKTTKVSRNKMFSWKMLFIYIAGSCVFVLVGMLAQACWPHLLKVKEPFQRSTSFTTSGIDSLQEESLDVAEVEQFCIRVIEKIKKGLNWPGEVKFDANVGAWTGVLPGYLQSTSLDSVSVDEVNDIGSLGANGRQADSLTRVDAISESVNTDTQAAGQEIAGYQVAMSRDGNIIGFQPTSRVAVNHWASNPLAQELYGGRKLSPGPLEPKLDIPLPSGVVLLELLMSTDPGSLFALARPIQPSGY